MTTKTFITICLFGLLAPSSHAQQNSAEFISVCSMEEEEKFEYGSAIKVYSGAWKCRIWNINIDGHKRDA